MAGVMARVREPTENTYAGLSRAIVALLAIATIAAMWPAPPGLVVQGLISGCLTALVAFGLGLVYRASRVVNLAQVDLGVIPFAVFAILVLHWDWAYIPALLAALAVAAAVGFVVERTVIRWFSDAPRLMVMIATIGLGRVLTGIGTTSEAATRVAASVSSGRASSRRTLATFPEPFSASFEIDGIRFGGGHVLIVLVTAAASVGLYWFLHHSDTGLALRAASEDRDRARLLGIPVLRVQSVAWMLASMLAGGALILRAGIGTVGQEQLFGPRLLLGALACAVLARMERFEVMLVAGAALGMLESSTFWATRSAVYVQPLILVALVAAMAVRNRASVRAAAERAGSSWRETPTLRPVPVALARLPEVLAARAALIAIALGFLVWLPQGRANSTLFLFSEIALLGTAALAIVVLTGWAGEVSLGLVAVVFVGAGVGATMASDHGTGVVLTVLAGTAAGAAASVLVGMPALRVRGLALAVVSLSVAVSAPYLLRADIYLPSVPFLPGNLIDVYAVRPKLLWFDVRADTPWYFVCCGLLVLAAVAVVAIRRSRLGRAIIAGRENPSAAQAFGSNLDVVRLAAFSVAGAVAGAAGALRGLSHLELYDLDAIAEESIDLVSGAVIGGVGSVGGVIFGTGLLRVTRYFADDVPERLREAFVQISGGGGLLFVMLVLPGGLASLVQRVRDTGLRHVARRRGMAVPSLAGRSFSAADGDAGPARWTRSWQHRRLAVPAALRRWAASADGDPAVVNGSDDAMLRLQDVEAGYGAVQVLFGIDLAVPRGDVVALLGTNGAGKSTLLNTVSGLLPARGSIRLGGVELAGRDPADIVARGVVQLPGGRGVFPSLTVADHCRLAGWTRRGDDELRDDVRRALDRFPVLHDKLSAPAGTLSKGQQQMLVMAMALVMRPRLLLVDELSLGLAPMLIEDFSRALRELQRDGVTVLVVDQSVEVALGLADTAYFLEKGEVRFAGPTSDLLERPDILRSVFLERAAVPVTSTGTVGETTVLEVTGLSVDFGSFRAVDRAELALHRGEILGVIGPNGAGKTTLFDAISGFLRPTEGQVRYLGTDLGAASPARRARMGLGRSFQDARLFGALTVIETIEVAGGGDRTAQLIELLGLGDYADRFCEELSTGTRRVVDLACQMAMEPTVVLFDEPSSGIAQREAEALAEVLVRVRDETGASLLVIEHDMGLITSVADRLVAMHQGRVIAAGRPDVVLADPGVVASYLGQSVETIAR